MKKIKLLAPLFGVATVAATIVPMVSCGDKLGEVINMTVKEDEEDIFMFESEKLQLKKDTLYTVVADLSKVTKTDETEAFILFADMPLMEEEEDITPTFTRVKVNKKTINEATEETLSIEGGWRYSDGLFFILAKSGTKFKMEGKVEISFTLDKDSSNFKFRLANDS